MTSIEQCIVHAIKESLGEPERVMEVSGKYIFRAYVDRNDSRSLTDVLDTGWTMKDNKFELREFSDGSFEVKFAI